MGCGSTSLQPLGNAPPATYDGKILVPFPVESALSGVRRPLSAKERLWYRRTFKPPPLSGGQRLLLHFGGVDWETRVYLNGTFLGDHRGGYDPFSFDVTENIKPVGENVLTIAVFDPTNAGIQPDGKQNYNRFAKPGGIAYTACSGIWQTVWLETVPATYIQGLKMTPDIDAGALRVVVTPAGSAVTGDVELVALDGNRPVARISGQSGTELVLPIDKPRVWSPEDPFLYHLQVRLGRDAVTGYFGMRKISLGTDSKGIRRILLNGKFIFQSGPLDQGYWPDGIYTAPTDEALRWDIEEMKRLGFNMVRKHLKVEPARWYYWCDRLGLLVWQDMPCGDGGTAVSAKQDGVVNTPEAARNFENELQTMIEACRNYPSIVIWTVFNEGWGQYDVPRLTKWVRGLDPSRLINSTSGWHDQGVGDIVDSHSYPGPVCPKLEPVRAAVLGEFGGLGLTIPGHTWVESIAWGYRSTSGPREFTRKYVELWRAVWHLKEEGLCAAVYTQLTDVETECNGLLTYDRRILKLDGQLASKAHRGQFGPATRFVSVTPAGISKPGIWRYTLQEPAADWLKPGFNDSAWQEGTAGFGGATTNGLVVGTAWDTEDLWLRRQIVLAKADLRNLALRVSNETEVEIYLNGIVAVSSPARSEGYNELDISGEAQRGLKAGLNEIAVHCHQKKGLGRYIDIELVREVQP